MLFAAYLAGYARLGDPVRRSLALISLPIFAIVSVQALISGANANWAASAHLAALVLAIAVLLPRRACLALGLAINLAVTLALPLAAVNADRWKSGTNLVLARYVGQSALAEHAADVARDNGFDTACQRQPRLPRRLLLHPARLRPRPLRRTRPRISRPTTTPRSTRSRPVPATSSTSAATRPPARTPPSAPAAIACWQPALGFETHAVHAFRVPRTCWFP